MSFSSIMLALFACSRNDSKYSLDDGCSFIISLKFTKARIILK